MQRIQRPESFGGSFPKCQGKDIKTINIEIRYVVAQDVQMGDID